MNKIFYFFLLCFFIACSSNKKNQLDISGTWQKKRLAMNYTEPAENTGYEMYLVLEKKKREYVGKMIYSESDYLPDPIDSLTYVANRLNFIKINEDKTTNRYQLIYKKECDCFEGEMFSSLGNVHQIQFHKIN